LGAVYEAENRVTELIKSFHEKAGLHGMHYAPMIDVLEAQEKGDRL
jgi:hypothetical protein